MTTTTTRSWRALVEAADPDFYFEGRYPVVYEFPGNPKRDSGPEGGPYESSD